MKVSDYFRRSGHETVWLIAHALGVSHSAVYAHDDFSQEEQAKIEAVISRRGKGEPLQYILGEADFWGRDFAVGRGVLIPRHDTETLIEAVMKYFAHDEEFAFIDWGTGSGCIAVTLLMEFPNSHAYLIEKSPDAAKYALINLERYSLTERAEFVDAMPACKLVISNPPYIPSGEIDGLMKDVRDYEPHSALDGGQDGMKYYREIFALAEKTESEYIILETGSIFQVQFLQSMSSKFMCCDEVLDDGNFPRCLVFRRRYGHEEETFR
ncbi:MAG: peptide chain release factor N(5)-glutamine methyltransferase [Synergistaceae bacterium]|nr:peptide chain release factor N(5)-glutamine methyltransferase [Synergistaceae bacterium]